MLTEERVSRGLAIGDLDDDGKLDVVINDLDGSPQILRNEITAIGNWLKVRLKGRANSGAIGAVVAVRVGNTVQRRLRKSGSSYISQEDAGAVRPGKGGAGRFGSGDVARWLDVSAAEREGEQLIELQQR